MIVYPFQPGMTDGYSITGFDEQRCAPAAELYLLPPGSRPPPGFVGFLYAQEPDNADARCLLPAHSAPEQARAVFCDTQISGGSLAAHLSALLDRWGARLWVQLRPMCMLFPVPCPSGVGRPVSAAQRELLRAAHPAHTSRELGCCYSFFQDETHHAWVFLFDTAQSCLEKLALLRELGVHQVFGPLPPREA